MLMIQAFKRNLSHWFEICWLPLVLIILFVVQNHLFNAWLNIPVRPYFIRRSVVAVALGMLLFGPGTVLKRSKYLYLVITSTFVSLIFIFQFLYYSYSGGFLQASAFFYAGEGRTILGTVKTLLNYRQIFFAIGPILVAGTWLIARYRGTAPKNLRIWTKLAIGFVLLFFFSSGYGYLFWREKKEAGNITHIINYSELFNVNALVGKIGVVNFSLGDVLSLGLGPDKVSAADVSFVKAYSDERTTSTPGTNFGLLKGRNLILIQVESLENAVIGQKIGGQEITPNLNKLSKQGLYFSNYYSPIGPGTTADAEFMTLNSLFSLPDTVAFIQYAYNHYTALPGLLKENGYNTYAFHGDVPSFWNRANIYPQLGYEKWYGRDDYTIPRDVGVYGLGDKDFFAQSIPKLKALQQPFMATMITLTSHTPFIMPPDLQTLKIPPTTTLNWLQQGYLQSVRYTDQAIGDFVNELKAAGLYNNSLILIYGDHSSFTNISAALRFKNSIFSELQTSQVPMIMLAPGTRLKGSREIPASHLDVYPTVADLLGMKAPQGIFGHDMVEGKNAVAVSRNLVSGTIATIVTEKLAYRASGDGVFENGTCLEVVSKKKIVVDACRAIYDEEAAAVKASDLMVKGDLVAGDK